jgi:hypothetical protein
VDILRVDRKVIVLGTQIYHSPSDYQSIAAMSRKMDLDLSFSGKLP